MGGRFVAWLAAAGLLAAAVLAYFMWETKDVEMAAPASAPAAADAPVPPPGTARIDMRDTAGASAVKTATIPAFNPEGGVQRIDKATREQLIKAIANALALKQQQSAGTGSGGTAVEPPASQPEGKLDKAYIQDRIKEIVPLVKECYEMQLPDQPKLEGKVVVRFVIQGDDALGGIVTESEVMERKLSEPSADFEECMRETMYALRMKSPEGGGTVTVSYPFIFRKAAEAPPE